MNRSIHALLAVAAVSAVLPAPVQAQSRDQIRIVGSSTVFPFSTAVAEQFGKTSSFKTPVVESTGTGGGLKLFCAGVGEQHPDIANASRRIKKSEVDDCAKNGVTDIVEIKLGYDGIVLANARSAKRFSLTKEQIFRALAKQVPSGKGDGTLVANPHRKWSELDASLPDIEIEVLGPPPTSGTRDAFLELAMEPGAEAIPELAALRKKDGSAFTKVAHALREDGRYIDAGENDNLIVQKLAANPNALGIFGYSFLEANTGKLQGSVIEGAEPEFEQIAAGKYGISRSLFFYVKKAHVGTVPGIAEYIEEFTSARAAGGDGYLADKGLIPLQDAERQRYAKDAQNLTPLNPTDVASAQ